MGPSPHPAGFVSLVLNLTTGNASPQIHVGHGDFFETARYNRHNTREKNNWKNLWGIDHDATVKKKEKVTIASLS